MKTKAKASGLRNKWDNLSTRNRSLIIVSCAIFLIAGASATWMMYYSPSSPTGFVVDSNSSIVFSDDFLSDSVDATTGPVEKTNTITLENSNGPIVMTVYTNTTKEDVDDGCTDWQNDCEVSIDYQGETINETSQDITVGSGFSYLNVTTSCERLSCPQTIQTEIELIAE